MAQAPLTFDIRHFSLDDGPGIRTTVFLKGCPLSCSWCHNPEGISPQAEVVFSEDECIDCGNCLRICQHHAIRLDSPERIIQNMCQVCGDCAEECSTNALTIIGRYYPPEELVEILLSDRIFYQTSGGGVTFSGGEPTLHMDYLGTVLRALKEAEIHVAIQTAGSFDYDEFEARLLPFVDLIYFDIKLIDPYEYSNHVRGDNRRPINNFLRLCNRSVVKVVATVPLVPGITATEHNLRSIARLVEKAGCRSWLFRPYSSGGIAKRAKLRMTRPAGIPAKPMGIKGENRAKRFFEVCNVRNARLHPHRGFHP